MCFCLRVLWLVVAVYCVHVVVIVLGCSIASADASTNLLISECVVCFVFPVPLLFLDMSSFAFEFVLCFCRLIFLLHVEVGH